MFLFHCFKPQGKRFKTEKVLSKKLLQHVWGIFQTLRYFSARNHRILWRKSSAFHNFPEMLPSLKSHNFRATEPFLKSRHSRNISWLQFVDFCGKLFFLARLKYPTVHLPEAFFRKIPCTALVMVIPRSTASITEKSLRHCGCSCSVGLDTVSAKSSS